MGEVSKSGWMVFSVMVGLLVALFLAIPFLSPTPNAGFKDSAAALALISGAAVGIERGLELVWTLVGQWRGTSWPRGTGQGIAEYVDILNTSLQPYLASAQKAVSDLEGVSGQVGSDLAKFTTELASVRTRITAAQSAAGKFTQLAPDNTRVGYIGALVADISTGLQRGADIAGGAANTVVIPAHQQTQQALDDVKTFLDTFTDNPGRRLISLGAGSVLGMGFAGLVGLDLFQAILETPAKAGPHWGVAITGLVIGLGSNPTHEVIRLVQEYKKNQKA